MIQYLKEILHLLGNERRKLPILTLLFVGMALVELAGLGLIGPYIALIIDMGALDGRLGQIVDAVGLPREQKPLLILLGIVLFSIFLIKAVVAIWINYIILRFSANQQARISCLLIRTYQSLPYSEYLRRNSSEYIYNVNGPPGQFSDAVLTLLRTISEGMIGLSILGLLAWTNGSALILLVGALSIAILGFDRISRRKLHYYGQKVDEMSTFTVKGIQESIEGLKEIRILGNESHFYRKVREGVKQLVYNQSRKGIISVAPRYALELIMVSYIILLVIFTLLLDQNLKSLLPILGVFGVASLRLIPTTNALAGSIVQLRFGRNAVSLLYKDLIEREHINFDLKIGKDRANFEAFKTLSLKQMNFCYPNARSDALTQISLEICTGDSIGLIGPSGSGKTTLVDILLGLLVPQKGNILYNNKPMNEKIWEWRSQVAYLPQQVFLIDNTLRRNVALGLDDEEIDENILRAALRKARLSELVDQLPQGVDTLIGERGVRISGGQRQRVALARAFYHGRSVLVMDEATSSLDIETEREIVDEIKNLKGEKTLIVIAHRLTTVNHCDRIYRLENGSIIAQGTYDEVIRTSAGGNA